MNEQIQNNSESSLLNLIFDEGLQDALPRIAEILLNAAMLIERERHIGAAPHQRSVERNGYATYYKVRIDGTVRDCATLIAHGVRRDDGKRMILGVSCAVE